jgi:hypothetical protein
VDTFFLQLIGVLLFVGLQFLVYIIYQRTNKTILALIPNFVLLGLGIIIIVINMFPALDTPLWRLTMIILIFALLIGVGASTFVSLVMIYIVKKRKNQPLQK